MSGGGEILSRNRVGFKRKREEDEKLIAPKKVA